MDPDTCAGIALGCDGPEDCAPGTKCCYRSDGKGSSKTICAAECDAVVCTTPADCPTSKPKCCAGKEVGIVCLPRYCHAADQCVFP